MHKRDTHLNLKNKASGKKFWVIILELSLQGLEALINKVDKQ